MHFLKLLIFLNDAAGTVKKRAINEIHFPADASNPMSYLFMSSYAISNDYDFSNYVPIIPIKVENYETLPEITSTTAQPTATYSPNGTTADPGFDNEIVDLTSPNVSRPHLT